ncbi:MAG: hypothetical protein BJ554DRAFT_5967, partial [Olpidium bornovanus]
CFFLTRRFYGQKKNCRTADEDVLDRLSTATAESGGLATLFARAFGAALSPTSLREPDFQVKKKEMELLLFGEGVGGNATDKNASVRSRCVIPHASSLWTSHSRFYVQATSLNLLRSLLRMTADGDVLRRALPASLLNESADDRVGGGGGKSVDEGILRRNRLTLLGGESGRAELTQAVCSLLRAGYLSSTATTPAAAARSSESPRERVGEACLDVLLAWAICELPFPSEGSPPSRPNGVVPGRGQGCLLAGCTDVDRRSLPDLLSRILIRFLDSAAAPVAFFKLLQLYRAVEAASPEKEADGRAPGVPEEVLRLLCRLPPSRRDGDSGDGSGGPNRPCDAVLVKRRLAAAPLCPRVVDRLEEGAAAKLVESFRRIVRFSAFTRPVSSTRRHLQISRRLVFETLEYTHVSGGRSVFRCWDDPNKSAYKHLRLVPAQSRDDAEHAPEGEQGNMPDEQIVYANIPPQLRELVYDTEAALTTHFMDARHVPKLVRLALHAVGLPEREPDGDAVWLSMVHHLGADLDALDPRGESSAEEAHAGGEEARGPSFPRVEGMRAMYPVPTFDPDAVFRRAAAAASAAGGEVERKRRGRSAIDRARSGGPSGAAVLLGPAELAVGRRQAPGCAVSRRTAPLVRPDRPAAARAFRPRMDAGGRAGRVRGRVLLADARTRRRRGRLRDGPAAVPVRVHIHQASGLDPARAGGHRDTSNCCRRAARAPRTGKNFLRLAAAEKRTVSRVRNFLPDIESELEKIHRHVTAARLPVGRLGGDPTREHLESALARALEKIRAAAAAQAQPGPPASLPPAAPDATGGSPASPSSASGLAGVAPACDPPASARSQLAPVRHCGRRLRHASPPPPSRHEIARGRDPAVELESQIKGGGGGARTGSTQIYRSLPELVAASKPEPRAAAAAAAANTGQPPAEKLAARPKPPYRRQQFARPDMMLTRYLPPIGAEADGR